MTGAEWGEVSRIFHEALALDPEERDAFIRQTPVDEEVRARVLELLSEWSEEEAGEADPVASDHPLHLSPGAATTLLDWIRQEPEAGEEVGRYRVVRPLGRGGSGAVYLAEDPLLERTVALKFLPARLGLAETILADPQTATGLTSGERSRLRSHERLLHEARAASALDHPHIGTVYEIGRDARGRPFLAMAGYPGGSLRDRLESGPLPVPEAIRIARQVADALAAAHRAGILHRDVKPENLVFDADGRVKVVDFGIATAVGREGAREGSRESEAGAGTAAYMAPERLDGAEPDRSGDLWALAAVLYESITGRLPWRGDDRRSLRAAMATPPPSPSALESTIPRALSDLVLRALALDPADRPPSAEHLRDALRRLEEGGRRWRAGWATAAVVVLILGGGIFVGQTLPRVVDARGSAADLFEEQGRVLVVDFQAEEGSREIALAAREALIVDLQQSDRVLVLSRAEVTSAFERMALPPDTPLSGPEMLEVAERLGAGLIIEGTVARAGNRVLLTARGIDPRTGRERFSVRSSAGERRLLAGVESLSREVRSRLGEAAASLAESRPLPEVTTTSIDALRLFAQAERIYRSDPEQALDLVATAVAIDSTFAMAHRLAAAASSSSLQYAAVAEHLNRAWAHRDRLPERERLHLEAFHASEVRFDPIEADRLYRTLLATHPGDMRAAHNLGTVRLSWLGDPVGAFETMRMALESPDPNPVTVLNGVHLAYYAGELEWVETLVQRANDTGFGFFTARWVVLEAFARGDLAQVVEGCLDLFAQALRPLPHAGDDELCGSMLLGLGDLEGAREPLVRALHSYTEEGRFRNVAHVGQGLAVAAILAGDSAEARRWLEETIHRIPPDGLPEPDRFIARTNMAVQAGLLGMPDLIPLVRRRYPPHPDPDHWFSRGGEAMVDAAHALATGDAPRALKLIEEAFPRGVRAVGWRIYEEVLLARALEELGDPDGARAAWSRAAEPGWLTFPFLTKDRIHRPLALEGIERMTARPVSSLPEGPG